VIQIAGRWAPCKGPTRAAASRRHGCDEVHSAGLAFVVDDDDPVFHQPSLYGKVSGFSSVCLLAFGPTSGHSKGMVRLIEEYSRLLCQSSYFQESCQKRLTLADNLLQRAQSRPMHS
jgi:hypothetical protein